MQRVKRVALYLRVSTDEQTTANQRRELEAVAAHKGWIVTKVFEDVGVSGAKGRDKRPGFDAMLKAVTRGEVDLVAAWAVDRLGRSLQHLIETLSELQAAKVGSLPASAKPRHIDTEQGWPCFKCWACSRNSSGL